MSDDLIARLREQVIAPVPYPQHALLDAADALEAQAARITELEVALSNFPCDGGCDENDGPQRSARYMVAAPPTCGRSSVA